MINGSTWSSRRRRRCRPTSTSRCTPTQSTSGALPPVLRHSWPQRFSSTQPISRSAHDDSLRGSAVVTTPRKFARGGAAITPSVLITASRVMTPSSANCWRSLSTRASTMPLRDASRSSMPAFTGSPLRMESGVSSTTSPLSMIRMLSAGTPRDWAVLLWHTSMRCSPCTGTKYLGLVRASISFWSSWKPWPDTWMPSPLPYTTLAPSIISRSIVFTTEMVLPGIGLAEKMIVSVDFTCTWGCSQREMRLKAARGSPWLPVISSRVSRSGRSRICLIGTNKSSGACM